MCVCVGRCAENGFLDVMIGHGRGKDVDHRNLISLTGSPADTTVMGQKPKGKNNGWGSQQDKVRRYLKI